MFKSKIYLGLAILVALGLGAMFHIYRNLGNVAGYLATLDSVSVPFSIASLEMEKNTGEYALGVLRYVSDPMPAVREEAIHDVADFTKRYTIYMQLSTTERERALGRRVMAGHQKLAANGNALMDQRDQLDALFRETTGHLEAIDALLDGRAAGAVPRVLHSGATVRTALQDIESETAEVGFWLTLFRSRPNDETSATLLQKLGEQNGALSHYLTLPLSYQERALGQAIARIQKQVTTDARKLLIGETDISRRAEAFELLANQIDDIFDDDIQTMLIKDLAAPQQNADVAIENVRHTLRYLIPGYFLAAGVVGLLLIYTILRPLKRLAEGTEAIGARDLTHRIPVHGKDEFAQLAGQFNQMAERLQQSTVSRELLEASEKKLRVSVTELSAEIAERKLAESEREGMRQQLQRSETLAAMGQLVAGVAHEVRNPLFGISSTLDAMEAGANSGRPTTRYHEVLRREVNRLNKLMTELLEFGRSSPQERSIEPLASHLAEAIRNCQASADAAGVTVRLLASDDALVSMHRDRLLQVHVNLIENALQHAPAGSEVLIATHANSGSAGTPWIEYRVMDSGPGFAAEDLPLLFNPFFTRRRKGTGLGLAIVRRIVDEHHGVIEPANRPQGGAVMAVRLPVARAAS